MVQAGPVESTAHLGEDLPDDVPASAVDTVPGCLDTVRQELARERCRLPTRLQPQEQREVLEQGRGRQPTSRLQSAHTQRRGDSLERFRHLGDAASSIAGQVHVEAPHDGLQPADREPQMPVPRRELKDRARQAQQPTDRLPRVASIPDEHGEAPPRGVGVRERPVPAEVAEHAVQRDPRLVFITRRGVGELEERLNRLYAITVEPPRQFVRTGGEREDALSLHLLYEAALAGLRQLLSDPLCREPADPLLSRRGASGGGDVPAVVRRQPKEVPTLELDPPPCAHEINDDASERHGAHPVDPGRLHGGGAPPLPALNQPLTSGRLIAKTRAPTAAMRMSMINR